jgi:hypothetical protein
LPSLKKNKDLSWTDAQHTKLSECFNDTLPLYVQKILKACEAGMDTFGPFQDITRSRTTACVNKMLTGTPLPEQWQSPGDAAVAEWSKNAFCPRWKTWTAKERGHVSVTTTDQYTEIDLETKRRALNATEPLASAHAPSWKRDADLVAWLEAL